MPILEQNPYSHVTDESTFHTNVLGAWHGKARDNNLQRAHLLNNKHGNQEISAAEAAGGNINAAVAAVGAHLLHSGDKIESRCEATFSIRIPYTKISVIRVVKDFLDLPGAEEETGSTHQVAGGEEQPVGEAASVALANACILGLVQTRAIPLGRERGRMYIKKQENASTERTAKEQCNRVSERTNLTGSRRWKERTSERASGWGRNDQIRTPNKERGSASGRDREGEKNSQENTRRRERYYEKDSRCMRGRGGSREYDAQETELGGVTRRRERKDRSTQSKPQRDRQRSSRKQTQHDTQ